MSGKGRPASLWGLPRLTPPMEPPKKTVSLPRFLVMRLLALAAVMARMLAVLSLGMGLGVILAERGEPGEGRDRLSGGRAVVVGLLAWTVSVTLKIWSERMHRTLMERFARDQPDDGQSCGFLLGVMRLVGWRRSRPNGNEQSSEVDKDFEDF